MTLSMEVYVCSVDKNLRSPFARIDQSPTLRQLEWKQPNELMRSCNENKENQGGRMERKSLVWREMGTLHCPDKFFLALTKFRVIDNQMEAQGGLCTFCKSDYEETHKASLRSRGITTLTLPPSGPQRAWLPRPWQPEVHRLLPSVLQPFGPLPVETKAHPQNPRSQAKTHEPARDSSLHSRTGAEAVKQALQTPGGCPAAGRSGWWAVP
ncbi:hypothetical protein H920_06868 [Fukomys damarensis]|uniref:Uncharacterized protein n=1 Tax=Fukomys damarensis TaxID=885580 RepID=A0A091DHT5_FUKDA|nr:hypothetical protein H920_06868 [Fukomys damarensis]